MKAIENRARGSAAQHQGGALNKGNTESHAEKKSGWQTKKFGEVLEIRNGRNQREVESADGEFPIYGSAGNVMGMATDYICEGGTTIIGRKGNINSPIYADTRFWNVDTAFGLTAKACMNSRFLYFFCLSYDFSAHNRGTTIPSLVKTELLNIPIPVPPLAEQQRIVGLLDEAFEGLATAKANAEKNLQNARALFESHLQSVFTQRGPGWVEKPIGELCERLHQGLNTAGEKVKFYDSGYPIIQTRNIDDGVVELDSKMKFMSEDDWQLYKDKYRPEIGDVFFTNIGTIGKTAIVTTDRDYLIHWNIFKLRPLLGKVTSEFLRYTLEQLTLSGYFEKLQKGGTVDFVTKKMISEALILLPAIAEQKTIVAKLDDLREETQRLARLYEQKLAALGALKKSLLHQAFTGKLQRLLD